MNCIMAMLDIPIAAQPRQESYDFVERAFGADPIGPWQTAFVSVFVSPQPPSYRVPTPATDSLGHSLLRIKPLQARKITSLMSKLAPAIIDDEPTPCCIDSTCWVRCFSSLFEHIQAQKGSLVRRANVCSETGNHAPRSSRSHCRR